MNLEDSPAWKQDLARYPRHSLLLQPALWAIMVYRFGRWTISAPRLIRPTVHAVYFALYSVVRLATGVDIPRSVVIGPGLMIHHYGSIIIHPQCRIGAHCTLRHGVTIGNRGENAGVPILGDRVELGAYSQLLGDFTVGDDCKIGAMTVLLDSLPPGSTAVGIPARIVRSGP